MHLLLDKAHDAGILPALFFSIVDRDSESDDPSPARFLRWDAYHIENYLLEATYVLDALTDALGSKCPLSSVALVNEALTRAARETLPALVRHRLQVYVGDLLVGCLSTKINPAEPRSARPLRQAAERSLERIRQAVDGELRLELLADREAGLTRGFEDDLASGDWRKTFRGRDVLSRFVRDHAKGIKYETLRNLIVARMRDASFKPPGMQKVVRQILEA